MTQPSVALSAQTHLITQSWALSVALGKESSVASLGNATAVK